VEFGEQCDSAAVCWRRVRVEPRARQHLYIRFAQDRTLDALACGRGEQLLPAVLVLRIKPRVLNDALPLGAKLGELWFARREHRELHAASPRSLRRCPGLRHHDRGSVETLVPRQLLLLKCCGQDLPVDWTELTRAGRANLRPAVEPDVVKLRA